MERPVWLHIAATNWRCRWRRLGPRRRAVGAVAVLAASVGGCVVGYVTGSSAGTIDPALSEATAAAAILATIWTAARRTARTVGDTDRSFLPTTVRPPSAALGLLCAGAGVVLVPFAPVALSLSVGFAIGAERPILLLSFLTALSGATLLAWSVGGAVGFGSVLAVRRSRYARALARLTSFGSALVVVVLWFGVAQGPVPIAHFVEALTLLPGETFVDLALLGTGGRTTGAALAAAIVVVGVAASGVTVRRLGPAALVATPAQPTTEAASGSTLASGAFDAIVSRPVGTVARKRWRQERRVPRGVLTSGYLLVALPGVFLPALAAGTVPGVSLVALVFLVAAGTGIAFGLESLGSEYPALDMTMTTVEGRQFVHGTVLAGVAIGVPVAVVGVLSLGAVSTANPVEVGLLALLAVTLSVCSVSIGTALSLRIPYYDFSLLPLPVVGTTVYGERGLSSFLRLGILLVGTATACLPVFVLYPTPIATPIASATGTAVTVVQSLSLLAAIGTSAFGAVLVTRRAINTFDTYVRP